MVLSLLFGLIISSLSFLILCVIGLLTSLSFTSRGLTSSGGSLLGLVFPGLLLLLASCISGIVVVFSSSSGSGSGSGSGTSKQARKSGEKVSVLQGVLVRDNVADSMLTATDVDGAVVGRDSGAHDESRQDGMLPRELRIDEHSDCVY